MSASTNIQNWSPASKIKIDNAAIRADQHGRYSLNDLHKASGGDVKNKPSNFLQNDKTQELVAELIDAGNPSSVNIEPVSAIRGGSEQGTYAVKELVYAYAMWISPVFHLKVIRTFDKLVTQKPRIPQSFAEALQLAADQARQLELAAPKVQYFDKVVERSTLLNATQVAQKLSISAVSLNKHLEELDVYNRSIKRCRAFQQWFVDQGLGLLKQTELGYSQPMFTLKGEAWVIERLVSEGAIS
ncbi:KilA-N domain-containing protein [Acinetobacter sp.]|uniref:KilA-N domain-containing protein n=1 Tax=Acinetobacter sp. TaxID=472 RepID=UPI002649E2B7|nr:KilA-N domain-containing protein [Acinetobacter sp.]MDN5511449.1 KilA-N domain-containing protein [Acinetobacter sp.]MDN5524613.1 KilA-N domain-containing protein [Acinetobacter sp.]